MFAITDMLITLDHYTVDVYQNTALYPINM
jgi:hypothetical protein